jgi:hypothetical protein
MTLYCFFWIRWNIPNACEGYGDQSQIWVHFLYPWSLCFNTLFIIYRNQEKEFQVWSQLPCSQNHASKFSLKYTSLNFYDFKINFSLQKHGQTRKKIDWIITKKIDPNIEHLPKNEFPRLNSKKYKYIYIMSKEIDIWSTMILESSIDWNQNLLAKNIFNQNWITIFKKWFMFTWMNTIINLWKYIDLLFFLSGDRKDVFVMQ